MSQGRAALILVGPQIIAYRRANLSLLGSKSGEQHGPRGEDLRRQGEDPF